MYFGYGRDVGVVWVKVGVGEGMVGELKCGVLVFEIKEERMGVVLVLLEFVKDLVVFDEGVDNVWVGGGEFVVDLGWGGEEGFVVVFGSVEGVEGENVVEVGVEGLFVDVG